MSVMMTLLETVVQFVPDKERDPLLDTDHEGFLGQPLDRVDGPLKVKGEARFTAEFEVPDVAHAALVYSTIAKGKVSKIDTDRAKRAGGVLEIFTWKNMPHMAAPPLVDITDLKKGQKGYGSERSAHSTGLFGALGRATHRRRSGGDNGAGRARRIVGRGRIQHR